ncbi:MAG: flagellar export chaperone FlgN [Pseudomonadota bacterium]
MPSNNIIEILNQFEGHLHQLSQLLDDERDALSRHDTDALAALLEAKMVVLKQLQDPAFGPALAEQISITPAAERAELEARHSSALVLARQVRDSNLVNGKVLHRSQKSVSDLLNILSGKSLDGLYGTSGQTVAAQERSSQAIARA